VSIISLIDLCGLGVLLISWAFLQWRFYTMGGFYEIAPQVLYAVAFSGIVGVPLIYSGKFGGGQLFYIYCLCGEISVICFQLLHSFL
jgi:hypothetical protein